MKSAPLGMSAEQLIGYEIPGKRVELIRGALVVREPAGFRHGDVTLRLAAALRTHLSRERVANGWKEARGRVATADPGFTLARNPDTVRAPDIAYVSRERFAGPMPDGFPELAPDLAIEVQSPGDRPGEVLIKVGDFLTAGSRRVWVVAPARAHAIVYGSDGEVSLLTMGQALTDDELLPGFVFPLSELFADD